MVNIVGLLIFGLICVGVPVVLVVAMSVVLRRAGHAGGPSWLLYLACVLFVVSWFLPSPLIGLPGVSRTALKAVFQGCPRHARQSKYHFV